jgi:type I restriction enzyme S subunit
MIKTIQSSLDQDDISSFDELPDGWECEKLGEIVSPSKEKIEPTVDSTFPYVGLEHIESNSSKIIGHGIASEVKSTKTVFYAGDVLYGKLRPYLNKVAIPDFDGVCSTDILVFNQNPKIDSRYLMRYLSTREVVEYANQRSKGNSLPRVSFKSLAEIPIPLPPLAEQQRIVARVEALLSHVDAAGDRLSRVPAIMKRFRQSVLAAACSGRLTEEWRYEQKNLESATDLYNNIQSLRMQKYEQAVVEAKKLKTRLPPKPSFLENSEPDCSATSEIPYEWIWKKVVNLGHFGEDTVKTGPFGAILISKEFVSSGIPIIAIGNVQWGKFDLSGARVDYVTEKKALELEKYRVHTGDVLFTRSGTIGRSLVVPDFADHWLMSYHLLRVRADPNLIVPQYLYFVFAGCESSKEYTSDATIGSTRPGINTTILENLPVPLPPLAEQREIVRRVGLLFERADAIEREVAAAGRRCERLTQAVMVNAFSGRL